ncbi:D-ribitol-5-phosphate cytidylyltransferase [Gryllus bimaculatus]|nr:D-ribitol-5-phosphate cytidylyltransferase [Gryllus bimaculatus]
MVNFDVGVILPAAGTGDRLGGPTPKQYCKIMGRPLFLYALQEFLAVPWVKKIALVVDNPDHACRFLEETCFDKDKLIVVQGEHTRHRSIRAGCSEEELEKGTECLQLALAYAGVSARLITGPSDLWKVTYKKDLYAATCCIRGRLCGRLSFVYK